MNTFNRHRCVATVFLATGLAASASATTPSFVTRDLRLPNPDRPYDMTSSTVQFLEAHDLGLYDLQFQPTNPQQLDIPDLNTDGNWEFESKFDIAYTAQISFGLGPVHGVTGIGTAHMRGVAPGGKEPRVFDTELLELNLVGLSSNRDFMFRESPTLRSSGLTILENACLPCAGPFTLNRVSSFFDIHSEASANDGATWAPGNKPFRVEQQSRPVVLGDYNENGVVDAADHVMWRDRLGPGALPNEAGISPGVIDQADYNYWRSRFGASAEFPVTGFPVSATPEPSTCLLLAISALPLLISLRRKPACNDCGL